MPTKQKTADARRVAAAKKPKQPPTQGLLNAREALYGFVGYLTSRKLPITLSSNHSAGNAMKLAHDFAEAQELPTTRENWNVFERPIPHHLDHLTNEEPINACAVMLTPQEAQVAILRILAGMSFDGQNRTVGGVLSRLQESLDRECEGVRKHLDDIMDRRGSVEQARLQLQDICTGKVKIVLP